MATMNNAMHDLLKYNAALLQKKRSSFDRSMSASTTFDSGYLIPIYCEDILPGDEVDITLDSIVRMTTPMHPTMDSAYLDFFAFFVPDRLVWDNAKAFYGENLDAEYNTLNEYQRPSMRFSYEDWKPMSLCDYLGVPPIPSNCQTIPLQILDFRRYQKIWNDWFRASEIQPSVNLNYGDDAFVNSDDRKDLLTLRKVDKLHDYFTSLLPRPQGGDSVNLPIGDYAPVVTKNFQTTQGTGPILYYGSIFDGTNTGEQITRSNIMHGVEPFNNNVSSSLYQDTSGDFPTLLAHSPINLAADLTEATGATINALRAAITVQQALEIDAAGGTRYSSLIRSHWGVISPDDVLQRPQLLGSHRENVGMRTVPQTSASTENDELGQLGAYSATRVGDRKLVSKAFTEYGSLMILCCVRPLHTYSQGYPERLKKKSRFDIYLPVFDNIGMQPVKTDELCAFNYRENTNVNSDSVFGYKNAWAEYRMANNVVTGLMRPDIENSLGTVWNYADDYLTPPILNSDWISEDSNLIDRTLRVQDEPQFFGDFYFKAIYTRTMGIDSIPGLKRF